MFIKNKKIYLICLLISCIGTVIYWGLGLITNNDIVNIIIHTILALSAIAGLLCGSLCIYGVLVKTAFRKGNPTILSLPGYFIYLFLKLLLILWALTLGLVCCFAFPGIYALVAWFRYRDQLI